MLYPQPESFHRLSRLTLKALKMIKNWRPSPGPACPLCWSTARPRPGSTQPFLSPFYLPGGASYSGHFISFLVFGE